MLWAMCNTGTPAPLIFRTGIQLDTKYAVCPLDEMSYEEQQLTVLIYRGRALHEWSSPGL